MSQYDKMITININEGTQGVSTTGFGTQLILGANANFNARTQVFTDADSSLVAALVGGSAAPEYKAVQAAFSQNPRPTSVKIGHVRSSKTITDNGGTYTAGPVSATVNGREYEQAYSTDKDTTLAALAAQIEADEAVATAVYSSGSHIFVITPNSGYLLAVSIDLTGITGTMTAALSATAIEDYDAAIDAIRIEDDDWFLLTTPVRTQAVVEAIAAKVQTQEKVFLTASADADIVDTTPAADTTTIAAVLKALEYSHTAGIYLTGADSAYPDAALGGYLGAQSKPGSYSAAYKKLIGQTPDTLTATQESNVLGDPADPTSGKNFNTYQSIGGAGRLRYGKTCAGGVYYIDYVIFKMWLKARLQEAIFSLLASVPKIPGTIEGATMIQNAMSGVFKQGQANDAITDYSEDDDGNQNGGYYINLPDMGSRSSSDKAARRLSGITFGCWYTDGIHTVEIDGVIN